MIQPGERERVTKSASPAPSPEKSHPSQQMAVKESSSPEPTAETPAEAAKIEPWSVVPFSGIQREYSKGATSTAAIEEAARKLHGTWVLSDGNTTLQLTVVNDTGSLRGEISEAGKSFRVEEEVHLFGEGNTVYVFGSKPTTGDSPSMDRIVLAFNFKEDGLADVVWRRTDQSRRLTVVSYVR